MTVEEMITELRRLIKYGLNPKDEVVAFNVDTGKLEKVTGFLYGGTDGKFEICTDDNEG